MQTKIIKTAGITLVAVALGAFLVVYGGYDDSPGAQLLGLVVALGGIVVAVRAWRAR